MTLVTMLMDVLQSSTEQEDRIIIPGTFGLPCGDPGVV